MGGLVGIVACKFLFIAISRSFWGSLLLHYATVILSLHNEYTSLLFPLLLFPILGDPPVPALQSSAIKAITPCTPFMRQLSPSVLAGRESDPHTGITHLVTCFLNRL